MDEVFQHDFGERKVDGLTVQIGKGRDANQRAFQFTNVGGDFRRDELENATRLAPRILQKYGKWKTLDTKLSKFQQSAAVVVEKGVP